MADSTEDSLSLLACLVHCVSSLLSIRTQDRRIDLIEERQSEHTSSTSAQSEAAASIGTNEDADC